MAEAPPRKERHAVVTDQEQGQDQEGSVHLSIPTEHGLQKDLKYDQKDNKNGRRQRNHTETSGDSGIGLSLSTASVPSQSSQSQQPQHLSPVTLQQAHAQMMRPLQATTTEYLALSEKDHTPPEAIEEAHSEAVEEAHSLHSENYGLTDESEECVEPLPGIKACPSLRESEHDAIGCNVSSKPDEVSDGSGQSAIVLPLPGSAVENIEIVCSPQVTPEQTVSDFVAQDEIVDLQIPAEGNGHSAGARPLQQEQEHGGNEPEFHAVQPSQSEELNWQYEFLKPTNSCKLLVPPAKPAHYDPLCAVCVESGAASESIGQNYPVYKPTEGEAIGVSRQLPSVHLAGEVSSEEETGGGEGDGTMRVESEEGRNGFAAVFLPPRPLNTLRLRLLSLPDPLPPNPQAYEASLDDPTSVNQQSRPTDLKPFYCLAGETSVQQENTT